MSKQLRVVIFENGQPSSSEYANELFDSLTVETSVVNVYDKRPATQILPVRAIPNVAVLLFADTMEEGQKIVDIVRQLEFFQNQEEIQSVGESIIEEGFTSGAMDSTQVVNSMIILPLYKPAGKNGDFEHAINEVCTHNGQPWRCCQAYNAENNPDIIPGSAPAHWVQFHTTNPYRALPFVHPTGAHDVYMKDECMLFEDGLIYVSNIDNNAYSPTEYAQGWDVYEEA